MSQCVPNWEADLRHSPPPPAAAAPAPAPLPSKTTVIGTTTSNQNSNSSPSLSMYDYDVAELTWENGQLALHGLGPPRINPNAPSCNKYTWEKLHANGTLESIVNQAAHLQPIKSLSGNQNAWFDHHHSTSTMDALVPSSNRTFSNNDNSSTVVPKLAGAIRAKEDEVFKLNNTSSLKRQRVVVPVQPVVQVGSSSNNQSLSGSTNSVKESWHVTVDTCDIEADVGLTCASTFGSLGNTISGKLSPSCTKPITISDHDSDNSQSRSDHQMKKGGRMEGDKNRGHSGKSSVSTRRSRAAAIHNQSERKRRDKINQRMKALQKLVPNSSKADKASMLDEVIEYIKQLQAQVDVMNKPMMMSNIPPNMMMPPMTMQTMQQQLQMSAALMAQMGMSMGPMGMGTGLLDMSQMGHLHRNNIAGISPFFHPSATVMAADPAMSAFLACQQSQQQQQQQQQMTMETYSRMAAALYQQLNHTQTLAPVIPNSKS